MNIMPREATFTYVGRVMAYMIGNSDPDLTGLREFSGAEPKDVEDALDHHSKAVAREFALMPEMMATADLGESIPDSAREDLRGAGEAEVDKIVEMIMVTTRRTFLAFFEQGEAA